MSIRVAVVCLTLVLLSCTQSPAPAPDTPLPAATAMPASTPVQPTPTSTATPTPEPTPASPPPVARPTAPAAPGELETTEDIGWILGGPGEIKPATFTPKITRAEALWIGREQLRTGFELSNAHEAPVVATVGLYTGLRNDIPHTQAVDLPVWVVIVNTPYSSGSGPPPPDQDGDGKPDEGYERPPTFPMKLHMLIDVETGLVVNGCLCGRPEE